MKAYVVILILFSISLHASEGIYFSASLLPAYGSGNSSSKSSLFGTGISATGGIRYKRVGLEMGVKRFTLTNQQLGDDSFETEIKNSIFFGGGRLFLNKIFSLKAGLAINHIEMDIYQAEIHLKNEEDDGEYVGLYGGMGIMHPISKNFDLYYESTLYPVPDVGLYFVDMEVGLRLYL